MAEKEKKQSTPGDKGLKNVANTFFPGPHTGPSVTKKDGLWPKKDTC